MSEAHLGRYCKEFDFRYNTRSMTDGERAEVALKGAVGKRLTYRRVDALAAYNSPRAPRIRRKA